jgi:glycosyltransferase involved in cell wall biosynthesis
VFVQSYEPRDVEVVDSLHSNLINVPISANWWVDHRTFRPLPGTERDADLVMIASWGRYKRHDAFFAALARLRARGESLRTILIGYAGDMSKDQLFRLARYHGVDRQLEIFERVSPTDVNGHLNRAKVNIVWSRREGINRAIIEGFLADTPGILRSGFNYGYKYPYINEHTGCFATEGELPDRLLSMVKDHERYAPREWILNYMNPQKATQLIDEVIGRHAAQSGERWTPGQLAAKTSLLDAMAYWDEGDRQRFDADYAWLRSMIRA